MNQAISKALTEHDEKQIKRAAAAAAEREDAAEGGAA